jgi:5-methylcytosine-specific restriction endonuclease McrA
MELDKLNFDESDKNLFQVDDPRLRADALKHSILPRLRFLLNDCVHMIQRAYEVEVFEDSIVSHFPHFRLNRENELKLLYESAYVGLGGRRIKDKWHGFERKDHKPVQILPFRYGIELTEDGLVTYLENYWLKGLTDKSYKKLFDFHLEYESLMHVLCYRADMKPELDYGDHVGFVSTLRQHYDYMCENKIFNNDFASNVHEYPVSPDSLFVVVENFMRFYPVYDSYLQLAMGRRVRFAELVEKLNRWEEELSSVEEDNNATSEEIISLPREEDTLKAKQAAEQRIKVMPAIRWQVFQRDGWKCVACGRGSQNDVILQVDHIIPRSKGGKDSLSNYQTLCHLCNIGKSNKDATDLRNLH